MSTPIDATLWREAMGGFLTGVTVVTTTSGGKIAGTAVNAFSAVSQAPPLLLVCLDRASRSLEAIREAGFFAVNVLSEAHMDVVRRFASKSSDDRFRDVQYTTESTGAPVLSGSVAWFDCEVYAIHDGGDHEIVVGRVLQLGSDREAAPLAYHRGNIWCLTGRETEPAGRS
ncbi:flavin reductase family protein [Hyphomonas sp. WL0036]|uniref:flavin reductase family protein n=1 Tax=Hyphomonas sediminis TaxID=2866160 RepID=UPI001C7E68C5|nr:flavin reductase family protein [Hyphomonas sediminis]MBY9067229.1 flavin reductase family protein [Hyphomonas sediminis]